MKRRARVLLSTISTAAMTAVFGLPAEASKPSADGARTPIERLRQSARPIFWRSGRTDFDLILRTIRLLGRVLCCQG